MSGTVLVICSFAALHPLTPQAHALQTPRIAATAVATRRDVIAGIFGAALLSPASAASAFDLPSLDGLAGAMTPYNLDDPEANRRSAAMANPDRNRQQIAAFAAVNDGDMVTLQAMADGGWALAELGLDDSGVGQTVLHRAAFLGNEKAVRLLIKAGTPIDAYTTFKETPLHLAVRNNRLVCVKALVEAGASTSKEYSTNGDTALTLAQKYKFESIVAYLESKGAVSAQTRRPNTFFGGD